jgi:thiamine biosynthesis lipoprotein
MGTLVGVTLYARSASEAKAAFARAFGRISFLDSLLSDYRADSEVSRLSTTPIPISRELDTVLRFARRVSEASQGAFDVTIGPLTRLWRERRAFTDEARALVNWRDLHIEHGKAWFAKPGMRVDLGAIGKGYAADEAARAAGVASVLVAASGDIVCREAPPGEKGWRVEAAGKVLTLRHAAVSTSGDSRQFFERDGKRYSHIIDPRKGAALTEELEVSVVARNGLTADALATALRVSGDAGVLAKFGARRV